MHKIVFVIILSVLSAQAFGGEPSTNRMRVGADNIASARFPLTEQQRNMPVMGRIATNTPAFEEYGFNLMLAEARRMQEVWGVDTPKPLAINNIYFSLVANIDGVNGEVFTKNRRFIWLFQRNTLMQFVDTNYWPQSFRYNDDASSKLTKIKSKITAKEAETIAREYLHRLGLKEKQLGLIEPPDVNQYKFEETDGTVYPLPVFKVSWSDTNIDGCLEMDISGIIKKPVTYFNVAHARHLNPLPTNYLEMLDVQAPTNKQQRLGLRMLPKRTNSIPK